MIHPNYESSYTQYISLKPACVKNVQLPCLAIKGFLDLVTYPTGNGNMRVYEHIQGIPVRFVGLESPRTSSL